MQHNPQLLLLILTPIVYSFPVKLLENGTPEVYHSNPVEVIENGTPEFHSNPVEVIENGIPEVQNPAEVIENGTPEVQFHSNPGEVIENGTPERDVIEKFLTLLEFEAIVKKFIKASTKVLLNLNDGKNELDDLKTAEELYQKLVSLTETLGLENLSMFEAAKYFVDDFPRKSAVFKPVWLIKMLKGFAYDLLNDSCKSEIQQEKIEKSLGPILWIYIHKIRKPALEKDPNVLKTVPADVSDITDQAEANADG
ncbi:hypothetical protein GPALN_010800 [Globodera pallida]|nr:hypothetical protein GPALN_010800 [Globodera pallida]